MYTVKAFVDGKEYTIHNPKMNALVLGNPYFEIGDNINGKAEFTVYPGHPYYEHVKKLTTDIVFYKDDEAEFYGRVLYDDETANGSKKVFVEGELGFLCDSLQEPKVYHNISVKDYFTDIINIHNAQVEKRKQFVVGRVTVVDSNDSLYRYSNWEDTRTILKEKLTSRLGGHLVIRHENGLRIIDYLSDADFYEKNTQTILVRKNLLDFSRNIDASDIATCVVPLGAKQEDSSVEILEERLTIASVNGGVKYVTDDNAVAEYGKVFHKEVWDDVTVPENLKKKGEEYLKSTQFEKMVLELKAIDMNLVYEDVEQFKIGNTIRCISEPNALDRWFPLSKKKVYITEFKKNTVTLGTETDNATYTSSNRQNTAEIEKIINDIPSKKEILKEALKEAQDTINRLTQSGHAIHTPNEFIVSDSEGTEDAKMLWRWGLGGLAHYSKGYDGPIDGVALTMDGKINGKMLLADSVDTMALSASYRTSVEKKISESETAAKEHADEKVRYAKEDIETGISNLENRIELSVSSVKEKVLRKNYILHGEQETLSLGDFSISGSVGSVTVSEFRNLKCFKIAFTGTGTMKISQSFGTLDAGRYKAYLEAAFPAGKRPNYMQFGLSSVKTEYFSEYTQDEFHQFNTDYEISKSSKTFSVSVYGTAGTECYITNIRCLRDIQELLDELDTKLLVETGKVSASVNNLYENVLHNYCSNGSFSDSADYFKGWTRSGTTEIVNASFLNKTCAKITNGSAVNYMYWRQQPFSKADTIKVRLKAACASGYEDIARLAVQIDGKTKYTTAGELSSTEWRTFEFEDNATPPYFYTYIRNYTANSIVYVTDIEILGYISGYSETYMAVMQDSIAAEVTRATNSEDTLKASIKVNADNILTRVEKGEFGSYVAQYYDRVITAFNNSSKYVQISPGQIEIYDAGVSNSKRRAMFDEDGNHFYRDGYYVGKIGTNNLQSDNTKRGLTFDLEYEGSYMTWAAEDTSASSIYDMKWTYVNKNKGFGNYTAGELHAGCNIDMHNYTLKNVNFEGGGINGTLWFVQILGMSSDGTASSWSTGCSMQFKNGILINGTWN